MISTKTPEQNIPAPHRSQAQQKNSLLLHICCGPCATHVIDLLKNTYDLIGFFFNPNIQPISEFQKRLQTAERVCELHRIPLWTPAYQHEEWTEDVQGMEAEPEGGKRCQTCFSHRLRATARTARDAHLMTFATTLTISPSKNSHIINVIGSNIAIEHQLSYLSSDFKKKNGFQLSIEKSRELGLYRQKTCGCLFSASGPSERTP